MKRLLSALSILLTLALPLALLAQDTPGQNGAMITPPTQNLALLRTMRNARFIYVTSGDGPQFAPSTLPEDQNAIAAVQNEIQDWGEYTVVYSPRQADMILVVQSRPEIYSRLMTRSIRRVPGCGVQKKKAVFRRLACLCYSKFHAALERATS